AQFVGCGRTQLTVYQTTCASPPGVAIPDCVGRCQTLQSFRILNTEMPRRLGQKLILSITVIVLIVAGVSGLVNIKTQETQLLSTVLLGAGQLSKGITSATWHAMLDDHREAAYQVMQTIALKQGIDRI